MKKHTRIEIFIEIIDEEDCLKEFLQVCKFSLTMNIKNGGQLRVKVFFN
jgi:hypothetical protein